ncbi:hypothetical protein NLI96_g7244 [Meripilus lineatus]|uniref:Uncharacterized protein n=1 Tax=Meripilus lineatus TaxID=2056292 RepID=A0AAD5V1S7_9APHY|nr:hypothetical protein NLI96_g7244 [Physisporinus lineatus]
MSSSDRPMTPVEMESLDRTEMESGALRTVQDVSLSRPFQVGTVNSNDVSPLHLARLGQLDLQVATSHPEVPDRMQDRATNDFAPIDQTNRPNQSLISDMTSTSLVYTVRPSTLNTTSSTNSRRHPIEIDHEALLTAKRSWEKAFHLVRRTTNIVSKYPADIRYNAKALILATLCFAAFAVPFFGETHPLVFFVCFAAICAFVAASSTYILPLLYRAVDQPNPVSVQILESRNA